MEEFNDLAGCRFAGFRTEIDDWQGDDLGNETECRGNGDFAIAPGIRCELDDMLTTDPKIRIVR